MRVEGDTRLPAVLSCAYDVIAFDASSSNDRLDALDAVATPPPPPGAGDRAADAFGCIVGLTAEDLCGLMP